MKQAAGLTQLAAKLAGQTEMELPAAKAQTMLGRIRGQFAHRGFVPVSEIAAACNVGCSLIHSWREQGLIDGINVGSNSKPYYRIFAPSVVSFFEKRSEEL